ncbi:MAG: Gfo/Idh/MocA family protein [Halobacteriales archaeon]
MTDIAVVGVGNWGQNLVRVFDSLADVTAVCHTGDPSNAAWVREEIPDATLTTDYDAVLESGVDAVAIATPIDTLADLAERALSAGLDVYVEKPMAPTRSRMADLAALARERDRVLFGGYIFVHHPVVAHLAERLAADPAEYCRLEWNYVGSFGPDLLTNLVCHPVSVALDLFGDPEATRVRTAAGTGPTDLLSATLEYPSLRCDLEVNRIAPREENVAATVLTEGGETYVLHDDGLSALDREAGAFERVFEPDAEPLGTECRRFLECVESGGTPATGGEFGVRVHDVLAAME